MTNCRIDRLTAELLTLSAPHIEYAFVDTIGVEDAAARRAVKLLETVHLQEQLVLRRRQSTTAQLQRGQRPDFETRALMAERRNAEHALELEEAGKGFDTSHAERVFKIFKRLQRDTAGAGVGLAVCKRIVERHRGTISAESEVGVGTTIQFELPKAGAPDETALTSD